MDTQADETGETIPFTPGGVTKEGSTWEPEQETLFRGTSQKMEVLKEHVKALYRKLSEITGQTSETFHFDYFEIRNGKLYYKDKRKSLTNKRGKLRKVGAIAETLGKEALRDLGFNIPVEGNVMVIMLNRAEEELPSTSDVVKVDDIELQEITEKAVRSTEDLIAEFEAQPQAITSEDLSRCKLLSLDKQLRSIRGLLKVETAKKVELH